MKQIPRKTDEDWALFLKTLAARGNVSEAARVAGMDRTTAYYHRKHNAEFGDAWDEAEEVAADALEAEMWRRGVEGVDRPVIYQGEVMVKRDAEGQPVLDDKGEQIPLGVPEYSDQLLIQLAKARRPDKFNERLQVTGPGGGGLIVDHVITLKRRTPEMGEEEEEHGLVIEQEAPAVEDHSGNMGGGDHGTGEDQAGVRSGGELAPPPEGNRTLGTDEWGGSEGIRRRLQDLQSAEGASHGGGEGT